MVEYPWAQMAVSITIDRTEETEKLVDMMIDRKEHALGKHGAFRGRPYRRGKNRCLTCGATKDAAAELPSIF